MTLIEQRDLTALSIADVAREAGLSRFTFYDHYVDLHELTESACTDMFETCWRKLRCLPSFPGHGTRYSPSSSTCSLIGAPTPRCWGPDGSARVMSYLLHRMTFAIHVNRVPREGSTNTHRDDPMEAPLDVASAFAAGALLGGVVDWLARKRPGTPLDVSCAIAKTENDGHGVPAYRSPWPNRNTGSWVSKGTSL